MAWAQREDDNKEGPAEGEGCDGDGLLSEPQPPSPPLPKTVLENLQLRVLGMMEAYKAAVAERDELVRREGELTEVERELVERLRGLEAEGGELRRERDMLRERCAEGGVSVDFDRAGGAAGSHGGGGAAE